MAVLLVDKADFPREKVCGCCLNRAAVQTLETVGLGSFIADLGGSPLHTFQLHTPRRSVNLPMRGGFSVSRSALDHALASRAVEAGAEFMHGVNASLQGWDETWREIELSGNNGQHIVRTHLVILANGLGESRGRQLKLASHNRIGLAGISDDATSLAPGVVHMAYHPRGYVGLVRLKDGRLNIAAAFDPTFPREKGGAAGAVAEVLRRCDLPLPADLDSLTWRGTPYLTRRHGALGEHRLLRIGDAAGYVEPFTGEGIAWALMSAKAVTPFAVEAARLWNHRIVAAWTAEHHRLIGKRQRFCRAVRQTLRHPVIVESIAAGLTVAPTLAAPFLRWMDRPASHPRSGDLRWA